jgi:predicted homoserine dehydrogenase-like protein
MAMGEARVIWVSVDRPLAQVYAYTTEPLNMVHWASGVGSSIVPKGDAYAVMTEAGPAQLRFAPRNEFGVLDHVVTLADGTEVNVPMRVVANGEGAVVMLVLLRLPSMSDSEFARDEAWMRRDLARLKEILERGS